MPVAVSFQEGKFLLKNGDAQRHIEKRVGLVLGNQFMDAPVNLFPLFLIVFPSSFFPERIDLGVPVGDEVKSFLNLAGVPDLIGIWIHGKTPAEDAGIKMFRIDEVFEKDTPLIEFEGDIDPDLPAVASGPGRPHPDGCHFHCW